MKKIFWPLVLLVVVALGWAPKPARADSPIAPFVDSQTNAVIYVDVSSVDMDQLNAWRQKAMANSTADPAQKARDEKNAADGLAKAKKWIGEFKAAGGKDLYVVVSLAGLMQGAPGGLIIPLNGANPDALAKVFNPNGNPPPPDPSNPNAAQMQRMSPQTAVVGNTMIFSTGSGVEKLKVPSVEPRQDLSDALAVSGDSTVHLALIPTSIKNNPFISAMMGGRRGPGAPDLPFKDPQWDSVTWMSVSFSAPPKESGNCTIQCKDADSAAALSALFTQKMNDAKNDPTKRGNMSADDYNQLMAVCKPTVSGSQVVIALDQNAIDNVVGPIMARNMQANQGPQHTPAGAPPMPPSDNGNGM